MEEWVDKLNCSGNIPAFIIGTKIDTINSDESKIFDKYISEVMKYNKNVLGYLKI
ncbi:MAG: hypothetical protein ACFFFB_20870 [Candidatus Heimdallarchaeota archaeon]